MKHAVVVLLFFLGFVLFVPALAAEDVASECATEVAPAAPEDVARVVDCLKAGTCKNTVDADEFVEHGVMAAFTERNAKYALWWSGRDGQDGMLVVWMQTQDESGSSPVALFVDWGFDGYVDGGRAGVDAPEAKMKVFASDNLPGNEPRGEEFRLYWQERYNEAIAAAIRTLL